jgi:hypothetical protein
MYLASKIRCAFGLAESRAKRFKTREKYRFIKILFDRFLFRIAAEANGALNLEFLFHAFYYSIATADLIEWLIWNTNKYYLKFEILFIHGKSGRM